MRKNRVKIKDVAATDGDFELYFCQFLDDFYHVDERGKALLIKDEPKTESLSEEDRCLLAAAASQLARDFSLDVPAWTEHACYFAMEPIYGIATGNRDYESYLRETSLSEFKKRNLYLGDNVLSRV